MPRCPVDRATNFIVEDESWTVVEYDHTSVPGVIYLSLTENKINTIYDNVTIDVADTDKYTQYELLMPEENQIFKVNDIIAPKFTLIKNGVPFDAEIILLTTDKSIARMIDYEEIDEETHKTIIISKLTAVSEGTVEIIAQLKDYPQIKKSFTITVNNTTEKEFMGYIEGKSSIKLDRYEEYSLMGTTEIVGKVTFILDETNLATLLQISDNKCQIKANMKNKLGTVTLRAQYNGNEYQKEIAIVPLW